MCSNLDSEQAKYLWEYRLHVEKVFYDRMNFYILLESVLLVAIVTIYSNKPITAIIIAICIVGFVVTVIWLYLQVWYKAMLNVLSERVKCRIPAYKEAMKLVKTEFPHHCLPSPLSVTVYLPVVLLLLWLLLFLFLTPLGSWFISVI